MRTSLAPAADLKTPYSLSWICNALASVFSRTDPLIGFEAGLSQVEKDSATENPSRTHESQDCPLLEANVRRFALTGRADGFIDVNVRM